MQNKKRKLSIIFIVFLLITITTMIVIGNNKPSQMIGESENVNLDQNFVEIDYEEIYFSGGCLKGSQAYFERIKGVLGVTRGYVTGDVETIHVKYDPKTLDLETVITYYLKTVNPTSITNDNNNLISQYKNDIYYVDAKQIELIKEVLKSHQANRDKDIKIGIIALDNYYLLDKSNQTNLDKYAGGYCNIAANPDDKLTLGNDNDPYKRLVDESLYTKPDDQQIKKQLNDHEYIISQKGGTEAAFTHDYNHLDSKGIYVDLITGEPLFSSQHKYDSKSGWPSFTRPITSEVIVEKADNSFSIERVEVKSRVGDTHLGHVFEDGPQASGGLRYCINGASLKFIPYEWMEVKGYGYLMDIFDD